MHVGVKSYERVFSQQKVASREPWKDMEANDTTH